MALLPPGQKIGPGMKTERTTTYKIGDTLIVAGQVLKDAQLVVKFYDAGAGKLLGTAGGPPMALAPGGFASSSTMTLPAGKYELKCYVGDALVAVFPFEVR